MRWEKVVCFAFLLQRSFTCCAESAEHKSKSHEEQTCAVQEKNLPDHKGARALRMIQDPGTHQRWFMEQNREHPERPAVLVAISDANYFCFASLGRIGSSGEERTTQRAALIVHPGDVLSVVDDGRRMHAELRAVALSGGRFGDRIAVRLQVGDRIVHARVYSPGRAVLAGELAEERR